MVDAMEDSFHSDVFGVEKEKGKVEGILAAVYQSIFGKDAYPSFDVVKIGWHIFLKDIMDYAAIRRES